MYLQNYSVININTNGLSHSNTKTKRWLLGRFMLINGIIGQGNTKENAISKLREAIKSFEEVYYAE